MKRTDKKNKDNRGETPLCPIDWDIRSEALSPAEVATRRVITLRGWSCRLQDQGPGI